MKVKDNNLSTDCDALAKSILNGFERHFAIFQDITAQAKKCFEQALWKKIQLMVKERIYYYDQRVNESIIFLKKHYQVQEFDEQFWNKIKHSYIKLIYNHNQPELAETFFNSIFCKLFDRTLYNNKFIFVKPSISTAYIDIYNPIVQSFCINNNNDLKKYLEKILLSFNFATKFINFARDITRLLQEFNKNFNLKSPFEIQVVKEPFFRNKAAYIIGMVIDQNGSKPMCIAILNDAKQGLYIDALLMSNKELSLIFSFARAYFLVVSKIPAALVSFLKILLPDKTKADLYSAIGLHKQGKTLLYRMFLKHINMTDEKLIRAAGIDGMVMLVFTFPVYPYVFKLIRDRFSHPKDTNKTKVKAKYQLIKNHDRVGRLADTWEFSDVAFPIDKLDKNLLSTLKAEATSSLEFSDNLLIIKHLYIEQKMCPLNIYLQDLEEKEIEHIMNDYGKAIKDIINANIFPGDMLLKNFGVTQQKRVVFYDYDEIVTMDKINFRKIPQAKNPEDEMSAQPWYHVRENDVFPEEFCNFLFTKKTVKDAFLKYHSDLLEVNYWQEAQKKIKNGQINNVFPYDEKQRMGNKYKN